MFSRYDLMAGSATETDPVDGQVWPDPLSVDYDSIVLTQAPYIMEPEERMRTVPYLVTYAFYQKAEYDDIILSLNNVPHLSRVLESPTIVFPAQADLLQFFGQGVI